MDVIKKCGLFVALFALSVTVLSGSLSNDAKAATPYDNLIVLTETLTVVGDCATPPVLNDVSLDWSTYITDTSLYWANHSSAHKQKLQTQGRDSLLNAFDNGRWAVRQSGSFVYVYWTEDTSLTLNFATTGPQNNIRVANVSGNNVHQAVIRTTCEYAGQDPEKVIFENVSISSSFEFVSSLYSNTFTYFFYGTINYPSGYEGVDIPSSATPTTKLKFTPDWVATKYKDFKVDFADNNFFTIDNNPFLCGEDGFAPLIEYTIVRDDTSEIIDQGQFSASSNLSYQFEKVPERRDYTITGTYTECEGANFTESSSFTFMFNEAGSQHLVNWAEECVNTEFPFFHIQSCMFWFENLINTFSFGTLKFSNDWTFQPQCRSLTTIGSWFQADSINVCPQVPAYVRNVVTPFVTFALGLLTIRFIATRSSDDYGGMK